LRDGIIRKPFSSPASYKTVPDETQVIVSG